MLTDLDIANQTLRELGEDPITSLTQSVPRAQIINQHYDTALNHVLSSHDFRFALKQKKLNNVTGSISNVTLSNPVKVTHNIYATWNNNIQYSVGDTARGYSTYSTNVYYCVTDHTSGVFSTDLANGYWEKTRFIGLSNGDKVSITDVVGTEEINDTKYFVTSVLNSGIAGSESIFSLNSVDGTTYTAYISGGIVTKVPLFDFTYLYELPYDFIALSNTSSNEYEHTVIGNELHSDVDDLMIEYIYKPTEYPTYFGELLSKYLAERICYAITNNSALKERLMREYLQDLQRIKQTDSKQVFDKVIYDSDWIKYR